MSIQAEGLDEKHVELEIKELIFFSQRDEANLFGWLNAIASVDDVYGEGRSIYVKVKSDVLTDDDLAELISIFKRYGVSMRQLAVFDDGRFPWLRKRGMFWYRPIFG